MSVSTNLSGPENNPAFNYTSDNAASSAYTGALLISKVVLSIIEVGGTIKTRDNLLKKLINCVEGKCIVEGYVKPGSVKIINYSAGKIAGEYIEYNILYECLVCSPVEGDSLEAITKTITKAGIHAHVVDDANNIPIVVFIAREHYHGDQHFSSIHEGDRILVKTIGTRFELNDTCVCVIASLEAESIPSKSLQKISEKKRRLVINDSIP